MGGTLLLWPARFSWRRTREAEMWRRDIAEEKQAQPQMARGCLCLSINAKQTTSLGKEDISLFISLPSLFFFFFGGLHSFWKQRGGRETQTGVEETGKEGQMKSISGMPETSGFIFGDPERKLQIDKTLMFWFILFDGWVMPAVL